MHRRRFLLIGSLPFIFAFVVAWFWPLPAVLTGPPLVSTITILDRHGVVLYDRRQGGLQRFLPLHSIPPEIIDALIATEDRTFRSNVGISPRGIGRAFLHDAEAGQIIEGGSTITQQLVRSGLRPIHRGAFYKLREMWLALKMTARYSKDEILERYLNTAYFGQQSYGIAAASQTFFGKDVSELSLSENALLVGLLNAPSSLNPYKDIAAAKARRDLVVRSMVAAGKITNDQARGAFAETIGLSHGKALIKAPHFVMWLMGERGGEWAGRSEVVTTLDASLQSKVEDIVAAQLEKLKDRNVTSAAVVVLDAKTGDVLSMVGSADYFDDAHDGAVNAALSPRQPGSSIKPFTYALALAKGMTAADTVADVESQFLTQLGTPYTPRNYDYGYHGLVRLREALGNSYNIAAIKVLQRVGVDSLLSFLKSLGISTLSQAPDYYGLALTLGDSEVKLLELSTAYGIFARGGETLPIRTQIGDPMRSGERVLDPKVAWLISDILSDNDARAAEFGRESALNFDFPVAAKTGTTRNSRDNWTIGFTPRRIVGVWVGNANNSPMRGTSGITGAAPIFHDVMIESERGLSTETFTRPDRIVDVAVCRLSGKRMTPYCPSSLTEHFIAGTEPTQKDDIFRSVRIDNRNGLLVGDDCDPKFIAKKVFAFFPVELQRWAEENGWPKPPSRHSPLCPSSSSAAFAPSGTTFSITSPHNGSSFLLDPLIPLERQQISLEAMASGQAHSVVWSVNGTPIGVGSGGNFRIFWKPSPGNFVIDASDGTAHDSVRIEVLKNR